MLCCFENVAPVRAFDISAIEANYFLIISPECTVSIENAAQFHVVGIKFIQCHHCCFDRRGGIYYFRTDYLLCLFPSDQIIMREKFSGENFNNWIYPVM